MSKKEEPAEVYLLLREFTYALVAGDEPKKEDYLNRCPEEHRPDLLRYINLILFARRSIRRFSDD